MSRPTPKEELAKATSGIMPGESLRCRTGDIAMITPVGPTARYADELHGKLVRVVRASRYGEIAEDPVGSWVIEALGGVLRVDVVDQFGNLTNQFYRKTRHLGDQHLTPLRFDEGKDETLSWAVKPKRTRGARKSVTPGRSAANRKVAR